MKSVTLCLFVFGLSVAAASPRLWLSINSVSSDEDSDSGEEWQFLPVKKATTTTEPPRTKTKATATTTTTATSKITTTTTGKVRSLYDEGTRAVYRFHAEPATWLAAYSTCVQEGGRLAVVTNETKAFFKSHFNSDFTRVFLGFDNWETGSWRTIQDQSLSAAGYEHWHDGEPNNAGGSQLCGAMYKDGTFDDSQCDVKYPFICQMNTFSEGYKYYEGTKTYYKFHVKEATWLTAYTTCVEESGSLAIIDNQEEADFIVRNFPENAYSVFLGFNNWERNNSWFAIDGKPLSEVGGGHWAPGEPITGNGTRRCGAMNKNGKFHDNYCDSKHPFVCEKKSNTRATGGEINHDDESPRTTAEGPTTTSTTTTPTELTTTTDAASEESTATTEVPHPTTNAPPSKPTTTEVPQPTTNAPPSKPTTTAFELSCQQIRQFVDGHNSRRLMVANGSVPRQPAAKDMKLMIWDEELAAKASHWASQNPSGHNPNRTVGSGKYRTGENIFMRWSNYNSDTFDGDEAVKAWFEEHADYTYGPLKASDFGGDKKIGHYTQMVWSDSTHLGCGVAQHREGRLYTIIVVCNYGPAGNYLGSEPYASGPGAGALVCGAGDCSNQYGDKC